MSSPARLILSPTLTARLATMASRSITPRELDDILTELAALPAHLVVQASTKIATAARLGWWRPEERPRQIVAAQRASLFERIKQRFRPKPSPGHLPSDRELLAANVDFAWLFLFHPNGYLRQAALDRIDDPPASPFFVAALAWRLNDWVPEVRRAAGRCAERVLHRTSPAVIADSALYLLDRRLAWGRWGTQPEILDRVFGHENVIMALCGQLQTHSTGALATCLRHAVQYPAIDTYLPQLATAAAQPAVRAVAYQCLITGKASWRSGFEWIWIDKVYNKRRRVPKLTTRDIQESHDAFEFIRAAAHDKSPLVRRIAADALIAMRSQLPDEEALIALLAKDRSSAVRSRADFMLRHPPPARV